jgi:hypothetical protein
MAKSWASVVGGSKSPAQPESNLNPLAKEWKPREVHKCVDCGELAQMCENGCDRPGNRRIVPLLGRDRYGQQQWGNPKWVCAGCEYDHEYAISRMPYVDMGPLPDADREHKLPFLCIGCADKRNRAEAEAADARDKARKAKNEQVARK